MNTCGLILIRTDAFPIPEHDPDIVDGYATIECLLLDHGDEYHIGKIQDGYVRWTWMVACDCEEYCECYDYKELSEEEGLKYLDARAE